MWLNSSQLSLDLCFRNDFSLFLKIDEKAVLQPGLMVPAFAFYWCEVATSQSFASVILLLFPSQMRGMLSLVLPAESCVSAG